ncbi:LuxR family transcriptional regulator [Nonomuraea phyllanthi]|uniref:ATP-binding protein n=1 Tax=Nonomuraea phyllanthi TaxID=2219224 RepID=UPI001292E273|nr:BTAD domain-containing putative transcriptional regulator [Nonomuraea phyllanthi]QFY10266.1 LuxR family transcriptional regulator [Nonomuraea phyllanthi]
MRFGVLGQVQVWTTEGDLVPVPETKVRALLADLLARQGGMVSVDQLVDDLWDDDLPANPTSALQLKVSRLRHALEHAEPGGGDLVGSRPSGYRLALEPGQTDVDAFTEQVARARQSADLHERAAMLAEALALWRGPAYADFADTDFARPAAQRLEEQRLTVLEALAETRLELGEHGLLIGELSELVTRHPLRERLLALQMRALYRAGRQSDALAGYARFRERLAEELGLDPGPELVGLHQAILEQDPALMAGTDTTVPEERHVGVSRRVGRLPAEVTSFIGRHSEVTRVKRLLSDARIVTLTGVGGVGKTRLALRVAVETQDEFPAGAWLVELSTVENPGLLVHKVSEALEIQDRSSRPALEVLVDFLRGKRLLLLLDNCEHLINGCALLAASLARSLPDLTILSTSRQALCIAGEQVLAVPALALAETDGTDGTDGVAGTEESEAVQLFAERASAMVPGFAVTDANRLTLEQICRRLDGIPLAIELAAARIKVLSVNQLLERLDDRFRLLTEGRRMTLPRQQTLRAMLDWSYNLCTEQERLLWARVSVFVDGMDLEAAESVCSGDGIEPDQVIDLVTGLVDKSVLVREERVQQARYRLLETVRQYGRDRLRELGDESRLKRLHRDWYRELVRRAESQWLGPGQAELFSRLRGELGNLRAALDCCVTEPDGVQVGLTMAADLYFYWIASGALREGRHWCELGLARDDTPTIARARALSVDARLATLQNDFAAAEPVIHEGQILARRLGDGRSLAMLTHLRGLGALFQSDLPEAVVLFEQARRQYLEMSDPIGAALVQMYLATAHAHLDHHEEAVTLFADSVSTYEAHGEEWLRSYALCMSGIRAWRVGDVAGAYELVREAIRLRRPFNDRLGLAMCMDVMAWIAAHKGDDERAATLLGAVGVMWHSLGGSLFGYLTGYHQQCEAMTHDRLGSTRFEAALRKGAELHIDALIELALGDAGSPMAPRSGPADQAPPSAPDTR